MENRLAPDWLQYPSDVNALDARVWPRHTTRRPTGEVEIAGVSVNDLAAQFGTPLYVITRMTSEPEQLRLARFSVTRQSASAPKRRFITPVRRF
ncbi:MAG: hypothetical protein ACKOUD_02475 [Rhodoluna sp.]